MKIITLLLTFLSTTLFFAQQPGDLNLDFYELSESIIIQSNPVADQTKIQYSLPSTKM